MHLRDSPSFPFEIEKTLGKHPPLESKQFDEMNLEPCLLAVIPAEYLQMIDIRRLARIRTKALMSGNAAKVGRTQDKIKNLKWQIESINT